MTPQNKAEDVFDVEKLAQIRKMSGLTQEELAEKTGLNIVTIQRFEQGRTIPTCKTLNVICEALDVRPQDFIIKTLPEGEKDGDAVNEGEQAIVLDVRKLALIRKIRGLSQEAFAKQAGVSIATVQGYEQGRYNPTPSTILKMCNALSIQPEEVMMSDELLPHFNQWMPCKKCLPKLPCLACDQFEQVFIPVSILSVNTSDGLKCYASGSLEDVEHGRPVGGVRVFPPEIIAWMPLPAPYKETDA